MNGSRAMTTIRIELATGFLVIAAALGGCSGSSSEGADSGGGFDAKLLGDGGADAGSSMGGDGATPSDGGPADGAIPDGGMMSLPDTGAPGAPMGAVDLPSGGGRIEITDLRYSRTLHKMIAPGERTGNVVLIDPDSLAQTVIAGFGKPTSVDEGQGLVFAVDPAQKKLFAADPSTKSIVAMAAVAATPDYVRFVPSKHEVWVTEAGANNIEFFTVPASGTPSLTPGGAIAVMGGLEGLAIDDTHGMAYTHLTQGAMAGQVAVLDVEMHAVTSGYYSGCTSGHGNPIVDEQHNLLFASCSASRVVVLDLASMGTQRGSYPLSSGTPTLIAYNATLNHIYLRGDPGIENEILGVAQMGALLMPLEMLISAADGSCIGADESGFVWICDNANGRLLRYHDTHPATPH
jgi:hypothetical protein